VLGLPPTLGSGLQEAGLSGLLLDSKAEANPRNRISRDRKQWISGTSRATVEQVKIVSRVTVDFECTWCPEAAMREENRTECYT